MSSQQILLGSGAATDPVYIDDIFSMHQYYGNGGTQNIQNGIDLTQGGLVWGKYRSGSDGHAVFDTNTGVLKKFDTDSNSAPSTTANSLTAFNANGFSIGSNYFLNTNNGDHMSWTWRKQEKFFDIVSYTGNGSNRTISHNLGSVPGMIIVKRTDSSGHYIVYHRMMGGGSAPQDLALHLVNTNAQQDESTYWNDTAPTSSVFSLGTHNDVNQNTATYVAWIFAHNNGDGIFGPNGNADVIACGGYNGNNSTTGPVINLGWEPQYLLIKRTEVDGGQWLMLDALRGIGFNQPDNYLYADNTSGESGSGYEYLELTSTGFQIKSTSGDVNTSPKPYIYLAIRRPDGLCGKPPDAGTDVFAMNAPNSAATTPEFTSGFPVDFGIYTKYETDQNWWHSLRLIADSEFPLDTTAAVSDWGGISFDYSNGWGTNGSFGTGNDYISYMWKRHAGFDVVTYTGNGSSRDINHSLGQTPEMIWVKRLDGVTNRMVYHFGANQGSNPKNEELVLNTTAAEQTSYLWGEGPTSSVFRVSSNAVVNGSGSLYVALLFSSVDSIVKLGYYTGTGSSHAITTGFQPRFIIFKETSAVNSWWVIDSVRGMSGSEKLLRLNSDAAQLTLSGTNVTLQSTGFTLTGDTFNANSSEWIYYAHA